ncbi:hypothetical protein HAX54_017846 [Datura stramonium]|uniref:Uncharacterized protein n=1 Tax=Datura stramonium TaxID=4076 RepID=A0ABS8UNK7_DATST|nr:hypothetical protein [Datura stramonium]
MTRGGNGAGAGPSGPFGPFECMGAFESLDQAHIELLIDLEEEKKKGCSRDKLLQGLYGDYLVTIAALYAIGEMLWRGWLRYGELLWLSKPHWHGPLHLGHVRYEGYPIVEESLLQRESLSLQH